VRACRSLCSRQVGARIFDGRTITVPAGPTTGGPTFAFPATLDWAESAICKTVTKALGVRLPPGPPARNSHAALAVKEAAYWSPLCLRVSYACFPPLAADK